MARAPAVQSLSDREVIERVAEPPEMVPVPRLVDPSLKETVPVALAGTVAVKVTKLV